MKEKNMLYLNDQEVDPSMSPVETYTFEGLSADWILKCMK